MQQQPAGIHDLKALRQPSQKLWRKIIIPYFFTVISRYTPEDDAVKYFQYCMYSFREK